MSEVEAEFLELFRDEANERLDNMVDTLLALAADALGPEALDSLFGDAHTIKGGAGMLGLDDAAYASPTRSRNVLDSAANSGNVSRPACRPTPEGPPTPCAARGGRKRGYAGPARGARASRAR